MNGLILGAGSFGCALAHKVMRAHVKPTNLTVWTRRLETKNHIQHTYPELSCHISCDLTHSLKGAQYIIYALPAQVFRTFFEGIRTHLDSDIPILITAKGLEKNTGSFFDEILQELNFSNPAVIFSGPHLAKEMVKNAPTIGLLSGHQESAKRFHDLLSSETLILDLTPQTRPAVIANAFKNVLALMGGILRGEGALQNTLNSFLGLGFSEMCHFGAHWNIGTHAFTHPALLGDFMLTTQSLDSRNTKMGMAIGSEKELSENLLAEGLDTLEGLLTRAQKESLNVPFCTAIQERLLNKKTLTNQLSSLAQQFR